MEIRELVERTGVPAKTIRYYEEIDLLPSPARKPNGYREYIEVDVDRLKLVAGARRLDLTLDDIKEILDLRDRQIAPCGVLLDLLDNKAKEINQRITELQAMEKDLKQLFSLGLTFPTDDVEGKNCVCHLVSEQAELESTHKR
jgi:DNA-binding transcriptional MerR regulator